VLVIAAKWWPLSARLSMALKRHGCDVAVLCPDGHPLNTVSGIAQRYRYRGMSSLASLRHAIAAATPDMLVPCDDGVVAQLHALHDLEPSMRPLIERSLGPPASYPVVRSRTRLLSLAKSLGVKVPRTEQAASAEELGDQCRQFSFKVVVKVDGESGGNGVRMCTSIDDATDAWRAMSRPLKVTTAWKRLIIDRDPLTLWQQRQKRKPEVSIQEFIRGRPANCMMVCRRGHVLSVVAVMVVVAEGSVGASTVVRIVQNPQMTRAAELLAAHLQLSGFFGLDFMIDEAGEAHLIEMNPRCTQLGHFELPDRGSLAGVFSADLRGEALRVDRPIQSSVIALFPQALAGGPACSPYIAQSYHDVPTEESALVDELSLPSWPQRQWTSKLYHRFFPFRPSQPLSFEKPGDLGCVDSPTTLEPLPDLATVR
jgi:carbamoylphosphate synthase large subunit